MRYPEGHVLLRNFTRDFPIITHGQGVYLFDQQGKRYLDASGGAFVVSCGHGNTEITSQIAAQLNKAAYINGTQFTSECTEKLADELAELARPLDLDKVAFLCSGSEAVEAAVKFARQIWFERGQKENKPTTRYKLIARIPSYHGNTLYALSASARAHYKKAFGPLLADIVTIPSPYEYRSLVKNYATEGGAYYAKLLEEAILKEGPETIAAFIAEPILGSSAGGSVPPQDYFEKVTAICKKYGILMIADEVLTGAGRTGKFFACEHFNWKPDILVLGKGISSGYAPLSVLMVKSEHVEEIRKGSGNFMHAQTYMQAPAMTGAGIATLNFYNKHKLVDRSKLMGERMHSALHKELADHPNVGAISGRGLLAGVEFVKDKHTKAPFERSEKVTERFMTEALDQGLILWQNIGHADGQRGDLIMIAPPLTISASELDEMIALLKKLIHSFF